MPRLLLFCLIGILALVASLPGQGQAWQWAATQSSGTAGPVQLAAVAFDGAGNTVVVGSFEGTVTLGSFTLTSAGGTDGVVARLSPAGVWLQAVRLGGTGNEGVMAVAVSATGMVWVAGVFKNSLVLGGVTLTGGNSTSGSYNGMFLANFTAAGQWQHVAQATNLVAVQRILPEASGDVLLVGNYYDDNTGFGTIVLPKPAIENKFVARYRPGTGWLHAVHATNGSYMLIGGMALDAAGNLVLVGRLNTPLSMSVTFGSQTAIIPPSGTGGVGETLFVARFGLGGTWTQLVCASPGTCYTGTSLALAANGDALIASSLTDFRGVFGSLLLQNPVPTGNSPFPFLARLSAAGTWTQVQGGVGPGGETNLLASDGSYTTIYNGLTTITVTKTTAAGVATPLLAASSPFGIMRRSAEILPTGQLAVVGTFYYPSATFGSLVLATNDQQTAFVAGAAGLPLATKAAGGPAALALFPNPARHAATLRLPAPAAEPLPLALLDALGRLVRQQTLPAHAAEAVLDLAGLPPGLYLVRAGAATSRLAVE